MDYNPERMKLAIAAAKGVMGKTHPNPAVGAVIEHQGAVVATGATAPVGGPHAESVALEAFRAANIQPDLSTVIYVTMEPCSTTGRTGACTDRIIASGIKKVVIGTTDPNPSHNGKGLAILRNAGISVDSDVLEEDCRHLNLIFNWQQKHSIPFVAAKVATTLDGRIATRGGLSRWITGEAAREDVHRWRRYFPAIAVGAGTVMVDNPILNSRLCTGEWCPVRFVFDRNLTTFKNPDFLPQVYSDENKDKTIVVTLAKQASKSREISDEFGLECWNLEPVEEDDGLGDFLARAQDRQLSGIYIEGGAHLLSTFLKNRYLHYLFCYRAPKLLADTSGLAPFTGWEPSSMEEAISLSEVRHAVFGNDQLMSGFINYPKEEEEI